MKECPNCGREYNDEKKRCSFCGVELKTNYSTNYRSNSVPLKENKSNSKDPPSNKAPEKEFQNPAERQSPPFKKEGSKESVHPTMKDEIKKLFKKDPGLFITSSAVAGSFLLWIIFRNTFTGLILLFWVAHLYAHSQKCMTKMWRFIAAFIFLAIGAGALYFIWDFMTGYDPNKVEIYVERTAEWEYLFSGHIMAMEYEKGDILEIWSRADFELKLSLSKKKMQYDSLMGLVGFDKYLLRTDPHASGASKKEDKYKKRREALNSKYMTIEAGRYFEGDNFNQYNCYQYEFLQPVEAVEIKAHRDSLLAYNTVLVDYKTEKWITRAAGILIFIIFLRLFLKEFKGALKEHKDDYYYSEEVRMAEDDVFYVPVPGSEQRLGVPKSFDLERIRNDLLKYHGNFDTPAAKLYISTLITVFKHNQQRKALREMIENMNLGVEYIKALKSMENAVTEYSELDYDRKISAAEKELHLTKLQTEQDLVRKRAAKEISDLEAAEDERKRKGRPELPKKSDYEILLDRLDKEHQIELRQMQSLKDKLLMAVQICDQIKKERPEDGEMICEDLLRLWHENGILDSTR